MINDKLKIFGTKKKIFSRLTYSARWLVKSLTYVKPSVLVKFSHEAYLLFHSQCTHYTFVFNHIMLVSVGVCSPQQYPPFLFQRKKYLSRPAAGHRHWKNETVSHNALDLIYLEHFVLFFETEILGNENKLEKVSKN